LLFAAATISPSLLRTPFGSLPARFVRYGGRGGTAGAYQSVARLRKHNAGKQNASRGVFCGRAAADDIQHNARQSYRLSLWASYSSTLAGAASLSLSPRTLAEVLCQNCAAVTAACGLRRRLAKPLATCVSNRWRRQRLASSPLLSTTAPLPRHSALRGGSCALRSLRHQPGASRLSGGAARAGRRTARIPSLLPPRLSLNERTFARRRCVARTRRLALRRWRGENAFSLGGRRRCQAARQTPATCVWRQESGRDCCAAAGGWRSGGALVRRHLR